MSLLILEELERGISVSGTPPTGGGGGGGGGFSSAARPADSAAAAPVANTHTSYSNPTDPYAYQLSAPGFASPTATMEYFLGKLGFRHVREVWGNNNLTQRNALTSFHRDLGITTLFVISGDITQAVDPAAAATDVRNNYGGGAGSGGAIEWFSGINEPDNVAVGVDWITPTKSMQTRLHAAISPLGIPVLSPPLSATSPNTGQKAVYAALGSMVGVADVLDMHEYSGGWEPVYDLDNHLVKAVPAVMPASAPKILSETGWDTNLLWYGGNPPAPEDIEGIYGPVQNAELLWRNFLAYGWYELFDERKVTATAKAHDSTGAKQIRERSFGLIAAWDNWRPKPVAVALGRVQSLMSDPGAPFTPPPFGGALTTVPSDVKSLIFGKRDGTYWIWMWRNLRLWTPPSWNASTSTYVAGVRLTPNPATRTAVLTLNSPTRVARYEPSAGTTPDQFGVAPSPVASYGAGTVFNVTVGSGLVILKVG